MVDVDPRLVSVLREQLETWRARLAGGSKRVGWKLGMGERERLGGGPVIGHLTSATCLASGSAYQSEYGTALYADAELALLLGTDARIVGYGAALEVVDLGGTDSPEQIVASNVFHRAVVFGPMHASLPDTRGRLIVNGDLRDHADVSGNYPQLVDEVAKLLAAVGECLLPGDRLITGSIVQVPIQSGDRVRADLGILGYAEAIIA